MEQDEMVALIRGGVEGPSGIWADLGAGTGNFTFALRALLGPRGTIYAVDRDAKALAAQRTRLANAPQGAPIRLVQADVVTQTPALPALDGVLMANLLHFVVDPLPLLRRLHSWLRPDGRLLVVEYEQSVPIPWVPHPMPLARLAELAQEAGFGQATQVGLRRSPSSRQVMYAACILKIKPSDWQQDD
jgi:ubiquinone/menaquinone biosynthesis C-methylase UbiE